MGRTPVSIQHCPFSEHKKEKNIEIGCLLEKIKYLRCCHISPDSANGRRTDRKKRKKKCLSGGESRLSGDEGRHGRCKQRIKRMSKTAITLTPPTVGRFARF